jgi:hypothetical protein
MSNVKIVQKQAGTILSDDVNNFFLFSCFCLWPQLGNTLCTVMSL